MKLATPTPAATLLALFGLLSPRAVQSGTTPPCRGCTNIIQWKLYTSGVPTKWPVYIPPNTIDTPGYFQYITENRCIKTERVDDIHWNIMMFTNSTYQSTPCCDDTDNVPNDYVDLCANMTLSKINDDLSETVVYDSFTELYWPWFLFGDDPCSPSSSYSENSKVYSCNPSEKIYDSYGINGHAGGKILGPGNYKLKGSTYHGCPKRTSNQGKFATGPALDTSVRHFYVKDRCP